MKILPTFLSRLACSNLASSTVLLMLVLTSTSVSHTLTFKGFRVCIEAAMGRTVFSNVEIPINRYQRI